MKFGALLYLGLASACTSPDYGTPTAATDITAEHVGGFTATPNIDGVHIVGANANYTQSGRTGANTVTAENLKAIIGALEDIKFLDLDPTYDSCNTPASDAPTGHLQATLTAGTNEVHFYTGCNGGMFDKLDRLEATILDKSGYTNWTLLDQ